MLSGGLSYSSAPYLFLYPLHRNSYLTPYSESQGLLQAAAGSGFIGFSAFQTPAKAPATGLPEGAGDGGAAGSSPAGGKVSAAGGGNGGKRRVKTAKRDGGYSAGSPGQVRARDGGGGGGIVVGVGNLLWCRVRRQHCKRECLLPELLLHKKKLLCMHGLYIHSLHRKARESFCTKYWYAVLYRAALSDYVRACS